MQKEIDSNRTIVFFDSVCVLCSGSVNWLLRHEKNSKLFFAGLDSDFSKAFFKQEGIAANTLPDSILYWDGKRLYQKSAAVLRLASYLKFPYSILSLFRFIPRPLANIIYDWIARNRYNYFGKKDACYMPSPEEKQRFFI